MSASTGPVSTLRGHSWSLPDNTHCDQHPTRLAVARLQGETDSFGAELTDCCQECKTAFQEALTSESYCDWCKTESSSIQDYRDFEEGLSGPVYQVCESCRTKQQAQLIEESYHRYF